jgi:hypothetical protein
MIAATQPVASVLTRAVERTVSRTGRRVTGATPAFAAGSGAVQSDGQSDSTEERLD